MNAPSRLPTVPLPDAVAGPVSLAIEAPAARFSLRIAPEHLPAAGEAFGVPLPRAIGAMAAEGTRRGLCLGLDEWMLWAGESARDAVLSAFDGIYAETPHSLVDVGEREIAVSISGAQAATLLSVGCPIDLAGLVIGAGKRTVFDGVQVVLLREASDRFTMEVWRSFLPHVWDLLNTANRELAVGV